MVGKTCTVCKTWSVNGKKLSYFNYPSDPLRRYKWLQAVRRLDLMQKLENSKTRGNYRICEIHFEDKYVRKCSVREGRKFLTKDAFPTLRLMKPINPLAESTETSSHQEYTQVNQIDVIPNEGHTTLPAINTLEVHKSTEEIKEFKEMQTQTYEVIDEVREVEVREDQNEDSSGSHDSKQSFLVQCYKVLPESMSQILKWHLSSSDNLHCGNLHLFALHLYYSSNSYNLLKEMMSLPTLHTLKQFLVPKTNKISSRFLNALKIKVCNMSPKERICSFSIGIMKLRPNLYYNIKFDRIIGFHEVNGEQVIAVAKYAIVLMVQGILEDWRQPIAYALVSEYDNFFEISVWIDEIITLLLDIGYDIKTFVADTRCENIYRSQTRSISVKRTYFINNNKKIYYVYDLQKLRNEISRTRKTCYLIFNSKLGNRHNEMEFFKNLNTLMCMLRVKTQNSHLNGRCLTKYEINFMHDMMAIFRNIRVIRKADGFDVTENVEFLRGFQITIHSIIQLYRNLNMEGISCLVTSRLSHTSLNSFFARAKRLQVKKMCTPRQFSKFFARSMIFHLFKKPSKPCGTDNSSDIRHLLRDEDPQGSDDMSDQSLKIYTTDYRLNLPEKNSFVFICAYCYLKCIQQHCCQTFQSYLRYFQVIQATNNIAYNCGERDYRTCRISPSKDFTDFVMLLESKFKECLQPGMRINSVGQDILKSFVNYEFGMPCPCFPLDYLKELFVRLRIFYTIRENNKDFKKNKQATYFKVNNL